MRRALFAILFSLGLLGAAAGCLDLTPIPFDAGAGGSGGADAGEDAPATD